MLLGPVSSRIQSCWLATNRLHWRLFIWMGVGLGPLGECCVFKIASDAVKFSDEYKWGTIKSESLKKMLKVTLQCCNRVGRLVGVLWTLSQPSKWASVLPEHIQIQHVLKPLKEKKGKKEKLKLNKNSVKKSVGILRCYKTGNCKVAHCRCLQFLDLYIYKTLLMLDRETSAFSKKLSPVIADLPCNIKHYWKKLQFMASEATLMLNSSFFLHFHGCSWKFLWTASLFGFSWLAVLLYFQGFTFRGRKYMSLQTFTSSFFYRHLIQMTGKPSSNSRQNWNAKVEQMFGPLLPGSSIKRMVIESYFEMKEGNENINITSDCGIFFPQLVFY